MAIKVLCTIVKNQEKRYRLKEQLGALEGYELEFASGDAEVLAALPEAEVLLAVALTPAMLEAGKRLKWVQVISAGVDHMAPEVLKSPVTIANARGMHVVHMSEHVLGYLLAFSRLLPDCLRWQAAHDWRQKECIERVFTLSGKTACIVGLGAIGAACAERLAALGVRVTGVRRRNDLPVPKGVARATGPEGLDELLAEADFVIVATPLTDATRNLIDAGRVARLKPGAYLVNIARAAVVDQAAMLTALRSGALAGAGLDVFATEPLPAESPLWDLPNVIVTPHSSGNYPGYVEQATSIFAENLRRWRAGEPLINVVDKQAGY